MSELVYLGHASFLIKGKEYQIVIDPYENGSVPNLKFPKVEPVDAVIASHSHADHSAYHLVPIKDNPNRVSAKMLRVPHDHENGAKRGMNLIHIFDVDGYKVVHMGDIGCVSFLSTKWYMKCLCGKKKLMLPHKVKHGLNIHNDKWVFDPK